MYIGCIHLINSLVPKQASICCGVWNLGTILVFTSRCQALSLSSRIINILKLGERLSVLLVATANSYGNTSLENPSWMFHHQLHLLHFLIKLFLNINSQKKEKKKKEKKRKLWTMDLFRCVVTWFEMDKQEFKMVTRVLLQKTYYRWNCFFTCWNFYIHQ